MPDKLISARRRCVSAAPSLCQSAATIMTATHLACILLQQSCDCNPSTSNCQTLHAWFTTAPELGNGLWSSIQSLTYSNMLQTLHQHAPTIEEMGKSMR